MKMPDDSKLSLIDGMPSGIRWTALLGTLTNIARYELIKKYIQEKIGEQEIEQSHVMGQGDDDDILLKDYYLCWLMFETYGAMNIPCHVTKNLISNEITEYLRKFVDTKRNGIFGYPARKITGYNFKSPASRPVQKGEEKINEKLDLVNVLISRGCKNEFFDEYLLLPDKTFDHNTLRMWLNTPKSLSGAGYSPSYGIGVAIKNRCEYEIYCNT